MAINMYHGIINIYKEAGYTSHDVVAKLRGILGQKKIGHTGTLDPDATGVLPVCLGVGTKLCDMLTDEDKEYVAELYLGVETDTQDMSGKVLSSAKVHIEEEELKEIIYSFKGEYEQVPPMYSALKVNGKKLYELAREGREIERKARHVYIKEIEIQEIKLPVVRLRVVCSKGTYIRTLCHDIGQKAGCGGAMKSLVRSRAGRFVLKDALTLGRVEELVHQGAASVNGIREDKAQSDEAVEAGVRVNGISDYIIQVDEMFPELSKVNVKQNFCRLLINGNCLGSDMVYITKEPKEDERLRIYDADGNFYGIYRYDSREKLLYPVKMFIR